MQNWYKHAPVENSDDSDSLCFLINSVVLRHGWGVMVSYSETGACVLIAFKGYNDVKSKLTGNVKFVIIFRPFSM